MHSFTEENYLKAIYKLSESGEGAVTTNAIAQRMDTKAASVTDMLKRLATKKLIHYKKYQGVTLTPAGKKVALHIIRKHRLWELFLTEKLSFRWDEVHDIAEQLEHIQSPELINRLDKFLGNPTHDPHGDPIPDTEGNVKPSQSLLLSQLKKKTKVVMTGVVDHSPAFLRYLAQYKFQIGQKLEIRNVNEFDHSMQILVGGKEIHISRDVAKNILVQ